MNEHIFRSNLIFFYYFIVFVIIASRGHRVACPRLRRVNTFFGIFLCPLAVAASVALVSLVGTVRDKREARRAIKRAYGPRSGHDVDVHSAQMAQNWYKVTAFGRRSTTSLSSSSSFGFLCAEAMTVLPYFHPATVNAVSSYFVSYKTDRYGLLLVRKYKNVIYNV